ncbi:MAG: TolC family protein [Bacteroidetes bacterium]|nr:TolC family protein [Bacteroidota bacterium]MBU1579176.1 TolC family protein [Bacteroidota bacterium]MBU2466029.1 TolC family protein [Bacteroidota bacterium]MBU2556739.1 TolC family protein [Bacteroidota bacterium]
MKKLITIIILFLSGISVVQAQTLDSYLEMAAKNNPGLQSKYKEFEAALQKIPQVNALPDPSFSFGYFLSPVETRVGPQRAKFSLSQMFPWFGTLEAKGDVAALMAEAKYQSFLEARNKLYFDVATAYFPLYELQQTQKIERENLEILESYKTIATGKFENGASPMVDVLRVDIMLKEAQTSLEILNKKKHMLVSTFNNLLNRDENEDVIVSDMLPATAVELEAAKDALLLRNPAINAFDLKMKASQANEIVAQKQGLPNIGVGLDYVVVGESSGMSVADAGKDALMPMVSVSIPLFRKKYKAAEKEAQFMQESYTLQKENALNLLSSEFDRTLFEISQQLELLKLYRAQIATTQQSLNLLFSSYGNSGKAFEEVLRMQQKLLQYEKLMVKALAQYHTATARLDYITAKNTNNE